jgi:hypothetical protein
MRPRHEALELLALRGEYNASSDFTALQRQIRDSGVECEVNAKSFRDKAMEIHNGPKKGNNNIY